MTVYATAQLRLTDRPGYDRYQTRFTEGFRRHRGTPPAADESTSFVEGQWDRDKAVLFAKGLA